MEQDIKHDPFIPSQEVWLIDSNPIETAKIRSGLSPKVLNINDFSELANVISSRLGRDSSAFGTLIITENLPINIDLNYESIVKALDNKKINESLFIYQITKDSTSPIHNAHIEHSIDEFLNYANNIHIEKLSESTVIDKESRKVIEDFRIQNAKLSSSNEELKKQLNQEKSDLQSKLQEIKNLNSMISEKDKRYQILQSKNDELTNRNNELDIRTSSYAKQISNYQQKILDLENEITENKAKIDSNNEHIQELNIKMNQKDQKIIDLQDDLKEEREQSQEYLNAKTEITNVKNISSQLEATKQILQDEKDKNQSLISKIKLLEQKENEKQDLINSLRNDQSLSSDLGYNDPKLFPIIKLAKTPIMYFKVIDRLPFINFYVDQLTEYLDISTKDYQVDKLILKLDQGADEKRYSNYTFIGSLDGINDVDKKYYLVPSNKMNRHINEFESTNHILVILDYLQNDISYFSSEQQMDRYLVIQRKKNLKFYPNLKGGIISYDHDSLMDVKFNKKIFGLTEQNKSSFYLDTLKNLISESKVFEMYSDLFNDSNN